MSVNAFVNGLDLYKSDESLKIWRVETPDRKGEFLFTLLAELKPVKLPRKAR